MLIFYPLRIEEREEVEQNWDKKHYFFPYYTNQNFPFGKNTYYKLNIHTYKYTPLPFYQE